MVEKESICMTCKGLRVATHIDKTGRQRYAYTGCEVGCLHAWEPNIMHFGDRIKQKPKAASGVVKIKDKHFAEKATETINSFRGKPSKPVSKELAQKAAELSINKNHPDAPIRYAGVAREQEGVIVPLDRDQYLSLDLDSMGDDVAGLRLTFSRRKDNRTRETVSLQFDNLPDSRHGRNKRLVYQS